MDSFANDDERGKLYYMKEFRNHLVQFLDELIEQFPRESDFVIMRIFIKDQIPVADVIGRFIRDLLPYKEQAQKRDDKFFIEHPFIYISSSEHEQAGGHVDHFTRLWQSDTLDENDRKIIWDWIDIFMQFGNKYYSQYGAVPGWEAESKK
jgi:hypothetical protein